MSESYAVQVVDNDESARGPEISLQCELSSHCISVHQHVAVYIGLAVTVIGTVLSQTRSQSHTLPFNEFDLLTGNRQKHDCYYC